MNSMVVVLVQRFEPHVVREGQLEVRAKYLDRPFGVLGQLLSSYPVHFI